MLIFLFYQQSFTYYLRPKSSVGRIITLLCQFVRSRTGSKHVFRVSVTVGRLLGLVTLHLRLQGGIDALLFIARSKGTRDNVAGVTYSNSVHCHSTHGVGPHPHRCNKSYLNSFTARRTICSFWTVGSRNNSLRHTLRLFRYMTFSSIALLRILRTFRISARLLRVTCLYGLFLRILREDSHTIRRSVTTARGTCPYVLTGSALRGLTTNGLTRLASVRCLAGLDLTLQGFLMLKVRGVRGQLLGRIGRLMSGARNTSTSAIIHYRKGSTQFNVSLRTSGRYIANDDLLCVNDKSIASQTSRGLREGLIKTGVTGYVSGYFGHALHVNLSSG